MLTLFDGETYRYRDRLYREVSRDERQVRYQTLLDGALGWVDRSCDLDVWLEFLINPETRTVT